MGIADKSKLELQRKLAKQWATGVRHLKATAWIVADLALLLRWRLLSIGLFGLAAVGCKVLAAGVLYLFVDALTGGGGPDGESAGNGHAALPFLNWQLDLQYWFVVGVVVGTALMVLATSMHFVIRRAAAIAAALFEERCVRRVIASASRLPHPAIKLDDALMRQSDIPPILASARSCNVIARQAVQLMPSLISLVASLIVLAWLDPWLTAVIALAFAAVVIAQYPMTNRSVHASDASETDRRAAMADMRSFMGRLESVSANIDANHSAMEKLFGRGSAFKQDIKTFTKRIDGMILGDLTARIGNHLILAGLFVFVGLQILSGDRSWASFALYVAIARMTMKDFQTTGKILGQMGKLFRPVERYMIFVRSVAAIDQNSVRTQPVVLKGTIPNGTERHESLDPGKRFEVLIPKGVEGTFSELYVNSTGEMPPAVIDDTLLDPAASLRVNLTLEDSVDPAWLEEFIGGFLPDDVARPVWPQGWLDRPLDRLPVELRDAFEAPGWLICTLKVAAAVRHGRQGVAIDAQTLAALPETWEQGCRARLETGPLFVVAHRLDDLSEERRAFVLIAENNTLFWMALRRNLEPLLEKILARTTRPQSKDDLESDISLLA